MAQLVEQSQSLVAAVARRFAGRVPVEDLEQSGMVGVMLAARSYDPDSRRAVPRLCDAVHHRRDARDRARRRRPRMCRGRRASSPAGWRRPPTPRPRSLDRPPTVADIAREAELDEEQVVEGLRARAALAPPVVDAAALDPPGIDQALEAAVARLELEPLLERLDRRSRTILALRFGMELSQDEIAERMGISQMHVSRLLRTALAQLDETG